jgi:chromate transporter
MNDNEGDLTYSSQRKKLIRNKLEDIIEDSYSKEEELLIHTYRNYKNLNLKQAFNISLRLGYMSFGGQIVHQDLIYKEFVDNDYITETEFKYILTMCTMLPGYSSTQMLAIISTLKTESIIGGVISSIGFILPSLFSMLILSYIIKLIKAIIYSDINNINPDTLYFPIDKFPLIFHIMVVSSGVCHGALAILIYTTHISTKKISNSNFHIMLLIWASFMYYFFNNYIFMLIFILICGVISMIKVDQHYLLDQSLVKFRLDEIRFLGTPCIILFTTIFLSISIANMVYSTPKLLLMESFLRIGSLSFGEGHVVVPLILTEYSNKMLLEESEVLNGYTLISVLPGPMFNIASFVGVMVDDILAGILSNIVIFIPGILFAFSALPFIHKIKNSVFLQYFIRGASSAALGFVFTACFRLWIDTCFVNPYNNPIIATLNVVLCFILVSSFEIYKPAIVIFGALFMLFNEFLNYYINIHIN